MITFSGTPAQCARITRELQHRGYLAVLGPESNTVTVFARAK